MSNLLEESEQLESSSATDMDASKMKVVDLKRELKTRGLSTTGIKSELVERLQESISSESSATELTTDAAVDELSTDDLIDESVLTDKIPSPPPPEESAQTVETPKPKIVLNRELTTIANFDVDKENEAKKIQKPISEMTQMERLELRAKRFGSAPSEEALRLARLEKFGSHKPSEGSKPIAAPTTDANTHVEKMKKRAERFGLVTSSKLAKVEEVEKLQKRKQRFSGVGTEITAPNSESTTLKRSISSTLDQEALKLKRSKRFGVTS